MNEFNCGQNKEERGWNEKLFEIHQLSSLTLLFFLAKIELVKNVF